MAEEIKKEKRMKYLMILFFITLINYDLLSGSPALLDEDREEINFLLILF
jgi:hypothetical protein